MQPFYPLYQHLADPIVFNVVNCSYLVPEIFISDLLQP
jgi:hypothetical protein